MRLPGDICVYYFLPDANGLNSRVGNAPRICLRANRQPRSRPDPWIHIMFASEKGQVTYAAHYSSMAPGNRGSLW